MRLANRFIAAMTAMVFFPSCSLWQQLGLPGSGGDTGGGPPPPVTNADFTARVKDYCFTILPNSWIIVEESNGTVQTHKTGLNELFFQFIGLKAPYTVTVAHAASGTDPAWFQTWVLKETRDITFTVPQNQANCPPGGGGGGGGGPNPGSIAGDITSSTGGLITVQTTSGGFAALNPGVIQYLLSGIYPGNFALFGFERDAQGNPTRMGLKKGLTLADGQAMTGVTLDLSSPYSTTVTGPINYPPGFQPTPGPNYSFLTFNLSLSGGGYISSIARLFGLGSGSYSLGLPDFNSLGLDLGQDMLFMSAYGIQVFDDRGTPFDINDDYQANSSFFDGRLVGQVTGSNPTIPINFPPLPSPLSPADNASLSRDGLIFRWNEVPQAGQRGYSAWISKGNTTIWQIVVGDSSLTSVHLPRIPNNEFDAFQSGQSYKWTINISTDNGSSSVTGMRFSIQ